MAATSVRVDPNGRLAIPRKVRDALGIEPGDPFLVEYDAERRVLTYAKADNPFDLLAGHALAERQAGRTRNLRAFAAENDIALDGERTPQGRT